jgi:hypothetical protein
MQNNLVKATLLAAILALAPAAGFAQAPNTTAKGNDAAATGTSQLPERPGYVGGNTVETTKWTSNMNEQQVRNVLKAEGYTDIEGLRLDSGTFIVKSAKLNGKKVENLKIDATNGRVLNGG